MQNFDFLSPTKIIFGKGTENRTGREVAVHADRVLLHYGGGSIKDSGLYDRITSSLKEAGVSFVELGGVKPNPRLSLVRTGIELCRKHGIRFILAVGGGSVIDSAKAIAYGVPYEGDVWDFYTGKAQPVKTLPTGVVLTIAAAGSEASKSSVITSEEGDLKRACNNEIGRPVFAIMNPELQYSLPPFQTACGAADIMAHVMERYFTNEKNVEFTDRLCEATLKTVITNAPLLLENPRDYAARAEVMWAGTLAHNDLMSTGRVGDFASHMIEHELSGMYDVAHGAGLAVVFPAWMKFVYTHDVPRFAQFAHRVWDVEYSFVSPERTALEGISRMEEFFRKMGLPVRIRELGISDDRTEELAAKVKMNDGDTVGNFVKLTKADIISILNLAR